MDVPSGKNPAMRLKRAEKRIECYEKMAQDIKKEIEAVNKKRFEQQMALLRCKRDSETSKRIETELSNLKMRRDFLKSPLVLERCNGAIERDKQQLEQLKYEKEIYDEIRMDFE